MVLADHAFCCADCQRQRIGLTDRQIHVLERLADGANTPMLVKEMHLSLSSVKREVMLITEKMGTRTRAHAVAQAIRLGLI